LCKIQVLLETGNLKLGKEMLSKIWLINILLAVCVSFFGMKAYGVWSGKKKPALKMPPVETRKAQPRRKSKKRISKKMAPPESAYDLVVDKNLFSPERNEAKPEKKKESAEAKPKDSRVDKLAMASFKKIVLHGVVIADNYKAALVTDIKKKTVPAKGRSSIRRRQKAVAKELIWVKVGDDLGDFKVADIMEDRVLLKKGSENYDVLLYDENKPKSRKSAVTKAKPKVISVSSTPPAGVKKPPAKRLPRAGTIKQRGTSPTRRYMRSPGS